MTTDIDFLKVVVRLTEKIVLEIPEVMAMLECDEQRANSLMHDVVLTGMAEWSNQFGGIVFDPLFTLKKEK